MIVIDKLCYQSRLRYENPGEKFAFAVITLCICVMSRSIAVACISSDRDSYRLERRNPCFTLFEISHNPFGVFIIKHSCNYFKLKKSSSGFVCHSPWKLVSHFQ